MFSLRNFLIACCCARFLSFGAVTSYCLAATSTERVATGFSRPVFATAPPGDTERLFIAEQHTGRIEILNLSDNSVNNTAFLDLSGLATNREQGLLGLAFDPDYANNGFFYVNITTSAGGGDTVIRRYKVDGDPATSNVADAASNVDVLTFNQPAGNHNGGWIGFSPAGDGFLYIASGDGGNGNDCCSPGHTAGIGNAQDTTNNLLGKILRIDPSREPKDEVTAPYTNPTSNPFVDKVGDDEIWSFGLRNPYRSSFDRQTGDLWIGDVGQSAREEIDFQPANSEGGENYGWRLREGSIQTPTSGIGGPPPEGNVEPIYDYRRTPAGDFTGTVVIGGYVYRGPVEELQGHYIFADAGSNNIWRIDPDAVDVYASVVRINGDLTPDVGSIGGIGSFGEDEEGNLYIMEVEGNGDLFRITTSAQDATWNGDSAVGTPGDGTSWSAANNWTRGSSSDTAFVAEDNVIFAPGSSQATINLQGDRTVAAVTFQAPYTLQNNQLRVLSGNVTVDGGVTATVESALSADTANHAIRKLGDGTLLVEGNVGQTVVKAGTLGGTGTLDHLTVADGGTVAPGTSPGNLSVTNSFTLQEGSTLHIEIGGTTPGTEHDRLEIGGLASLAGGTLDVDLIDIGNGTYQPQAGDSFAILAATGGFDMFGDTDLPTLEPGLAWELNPGGITLFLNVEIALPGDYNLNGVVDAADYAAWLSTLGDSVVAGSFADGNGDGTINLADYNVWKSNLGDTLQGQSSAGVPEPASGLLVLLTLLGSSCCIRCSAAESTR